MRSICVIPYESGDEVYAVLPLYGPVHELVGAEVGVPAEDDNCMFPVLAQHPYQP